MKLVGAARKGNVERGSGNGERDREGKIALVSVNIYARRLSNPENSPAKTSAKTKPILSLLVAPFKFTLSTTLQLIKATVLAESS